MEPSDLKDAFDNELRRGIIENHPEFDKWFDTLSPAAQHIVKSVLKEDVTPELIDFAQNTMEEEGSSHLFIFTIAGGFPTPNVAIALTNIALEDICGHVFSFGRHAE